MVADPRTLEPMARDEKSLGEVFMRDNMAHYKCPRFVVFGPLPRTSTGKVQKFILRAQAKRV